MTMNSHLRIDVHFDLICPWCLIGKRHLATAVQQFRRLRPEVAVDIAWQSHELLPDTPLEGLPYQAFYERRLGSPAAVAARRAQVQEAARTAGIEFAFERIQVLPNTRAAHRLIALANHDGPPARSAALVERLFAAYFLEGRNIGDPEVLARISAEFGLDPAGTAAIRDAANGGADSGKDSPGATRLQVPGVPFFVFNDRFAISGAHPHQTLLEAMQSAVEPLPPAEPAAARERVA
jgi:predicted DsbA family dithiol-disulfide isomerase